MLHWRSEEGDGGASRSLFGRHKWEKVTGNVIERRVLPGPHAPHPKLFVVQLHPAGRDPVMAEIHVSPHDRDYGDLFQPDAGDVTGFIWDPESGEAHFDMDDKRNSMGAHVDDTDALMEQMLANEPAPIGEAVTGPPWVVPAVCPVCSAPVDQAGQAMELQPQCAYCHQPLPAQPRAQL